jgi:hypothetical protein
MPLMEGGYWDLWVGPSPKVPYNPNLFLRHYWFFDYGAGWQLDLAVHPRDAATHSPLRRAHMFITASATRSTGMSRTHNGSG